MERNQTRGKIVDVKILLIAGGCLLAIVLVSALSYVLVSSPKSHPVPLERPSTLPPLMPARTTAPRQVTGIGLVKQFNGAFTLSNAKVEVLDGVIYWSVTVKNETTGMGYCSVSLTFCDARGNELDADSHGADFVGGEIKVVSHKDRHCRADVIDRVVACRITADWDFPDFLSTDEEDR